MSRRSTDPNTTEFLHITNRCHNRDRFPLPLERCWEILADDLRFCQFSFNLDIVAFVLMPNHYHLLVRANEGNIGQAMAHFNRESARQINREAGKINQLWCGRYFRTELINFHYFRNVHKYIYQNPIRAGIVRKVESYPYSTLPGLIGISHAPLLVNDSLLFESDTIDQYLDWLNELPEKAHVEYIRKALRRRKFQLPKVSKRANPLENLIL